MRRFELVEGKSSKFWEVEARGTTLTVRYGRIGTAGQAKDKRFASADQAAKEAEKLIHEKTAKGYTPDVSGAAYQGKYLAGGRFNGNNAAFLILHQLFGILLQFNA